MIDIAKIYQPKKNNPYILPNEVYIQVIYLVRDYERLKEEYHEIVGQSPEPSDGQPRGSNLTDPTAKGGMLLATIANKLEAVEQSYIAVPEEYREGIMQNIVSYIPYPDTAHRNTWSRQKCKFLYNIAKKMFWK